MEGSVVLEITFPIVSFITNFTLVTLAINVDVSCEVAGLATGDSLIISIEVSADTFDACVVAITGAVEDSISISDIVVGVLSLASIAM